MDTEGKPLSSPRIHLFHLLRHPAHVGLCYLVVLEVVPEARRTQELCAPSKYSQLYRATNAPLCPVVWAEGITAAAHQAEKIMWKTSRGDQQLTGTTTEHLLNAQLLGTHPQAENSPIKGKINPIRFREHADPGEASANIEVRY